MIIAFMYTLFLSMSLPKKIQLVLVVRSLTIYVSKSCEPSKFFSVDKIIFDEVNHAKMKSLTR